MEETYEQWAAEQQKQIHAELLKLEEEMSALTTDQGKTWYDLSEDNQKKLSKMISRHNHLMVVVDQY